MAQRYDVAVLGTGNAGRAAASKLADCGRSVAIVETRDAVGGTCPLRGCVPKKVLVAAAQAMQEIAAAATFPVHRPSRPPSRGVATC